MSAIAKFLVDYGLSHDDWRDSPKVKYSSGRCFGQKNIPKQRVWVQGSVELPLALRGRHSSTTIRNVRKHGTDVAWHKNTICGRRRSEVAHYRTRRYSRWSAWIRAASSPSRNSLAPREVTDVHLSVNARSVRHAVTAAAGRRARAESSRAARRRRDGALMRFVAPITARSPSSGARSLSLARPVIILSGSCSRRPNNATEYRDSAAEREREAFYTPCARRRRSADESPAYTETERRCGGHNV